MPGCMHCLNFQKIREVSTRDLLVNEIIFHDLYSKLTEQNSPHGSKSQLGVNKSNANCASRMLSATLMTSTMKFGWGSGRLCSLLRYSLTSVYWKCISLLFLLCLKIWIWCIEICFKSLIICILIWLLQTYSFLIPFMSVGALSFPRYGS